MPENAVYKYSNKLYNVPIAFEDSHWPLNKGRMKIDKYLGRGA